MTDRARHKISDHASPSVDGRSARGQGALMHLLNPFADAVSDDLPLTRLLRLSMFQVCVGMTAVLLTGALNRVMIIELGVPATLVALMVSLPLVFAPLRALIGHRSDNYQSAFGWRRGPFIWFGALLQFGGLAIMPFSLLVLSMDKPELVWLGQAAAALAFLSVGAGMHTTQTAGLALATDIAPEKHRARVIAVLYIMLLVGMTVSALVFGWLLTDFSPVRLIRVVQGSAVAAMAFNIIALWKQETPDLIRTRPDAPRNSFRAAWASFTRYDGAKRLLWSVGLGAAAFSMQEILLEPYGAEVLGLSVSQTTLLTALFAAGTIVGFLLAAVQLSRHGEPHRLAGFGALLGIFAFAMIILSAPLEAGALFRVGVFALGLGGGLYSVCTLTAVMALADGDNTGIALGAWGAVQATSAGIAVALGGALRDGLAHLSTSGALGPAMTGPEAAYGIVYHIEILLLFISMAAIGPLARHSAARPGQKMESFELKAFPQ